MDWKRDNYNMIHIVIDYLTQIVHHEPVKTTINVAGLAEVIINVVVRHHGLSESIVSDSDLLFIFKFWFLLCYIFDIKQKLFTVFHLQIDGRTERLNSTMEIYPRVFVN